jgi:hypothetical protein
MRPAILTYFIVSFFMLFGSANADIVVFEFSGRITQVPIDDVFGNIAEGDAIKGKYLFDTSAADLVPGNPAIGSYSWNAPFGMFATIGVHDFVALGSLNIGIMNSFVDQYTVFAQNADGNITLELFLQDNMGAVFANDNLPLMAPPIENFEQRDFHFRGLFNGNEIQVDGRLDASDVQAVPEPSALVPLALGSMLVALARWRASRT